MSAKKYYSIVFDQAMQDAVDRASNRLDHYDSVKFIAVTGDDAIALFDCQYQKDRYIMAIASNPYSVSESKVG
jgi:hypothetical protein